MNRILFSRSATADGGKFSKQATTELESFSTLNKVPNVGLAGSLTTRSSGTGGVVTTTNSPSGNIASTNKVAVGWNNTTTGVFEWAWYGTATVSGNAITVAGLNGTALPTQGTAVVIAKIAAEPLSVPSTSAKLVAGAPVGSSRMVAVLGLTAEVDAGSPDYTNVILLDCEGPKDAEFLETTSEFGAKNTDFVSADRAYVANLSTVSGANIQIVSGYN